MSALFGRSVHRLLQSFDHKRRDWGLTGIRLKGHMNARSTLPTRLLHRDVKLPLDRLLHAQEAIEFVLQLAATLARALVAGT